MPADEAGLRWLEQEARADVALRRGGPQLLADRPAIDDGWPAVIADGTVLVAVIDEVPVGYLVLDARGSTAVVEQVYVTPEARDLGFGDGLLETAMDVARSAGATAIEAEALPGDRETKNLYERAGVTARKLTVWRLL